MDAGRLHNIATIQGSDLMYQYNDCPPFTQQGRDRERESQVVHLAVTRPPGLCSPRTVLAPVVAEVPIWVSEGRVPGGRPDHSCYGWRGGLGVLVHDPGINRARGGEKGDEQGGYWREKSQLYYSPSPTPSIEHRSTLSFYDNLPGPETLDRIQNVFEMESSFREHFQENMRAPEMVRGEASDLWSESGLDNQHQEIGHQQESVSCGLVYGDQMLELQQSDSPQRHRRNPWAQSEVQQPEQTHWTPKVPPPLPLADPSASALRSLLTNLQQEIVRQHKVYEARIVSLEERNKELQAEVVLLKTNLSRQRHWYQVVQAKTTESERARTAAELRNSALQKDMEQFFDTFGDLNNEAKKTENIIRRF
ncbi:uncharacterized protein LOC133408080 [Phycodurus eques]|uniref:uncharacterized protein LOC133408080 n=1 Tax=Phycodurus eques TaxID=693459 RepID=UPI002ACDA3C3|nr:uncharacterized protein LOC133408080 [Phycodurus eques]